MKEQACIDIGIDIASDFMKQILKLKLDKVDELRVLTVVSTRINDYVNNSLKNLEKEGVITLTPEVKNVNN